MLRSNSPFSFSAAGAQAADPDPHPPDAPHGLNSPIGRVYELDGQVLLLGSITPPIPPSTWPSPYLACATGAKYVTLLQNASRRALTTARSTTAVRTCPGGWLAGRRVCSAWEPWDARGRGWPARGTWWRW